MKYITCKTSHNTGEVFVDAMKIRSNEVYAIVEAESAEHAKELLKCKLKCPVCGSDHTYIEDIIVSDTGWKVGETLECDDCKAGKHEAE